VQCDPYWNFI